MASLVSTTVARAGGFQATRGSRLGGPYVAVMSIDLRPPRAQVQVLLYGAWQSADRDDDADVAPLIWRDGVWELDLIAPPMAHPHDVTYLIALVEHLDEDPFVFKSMILDAVIKAVDDTAHLALKTRVRCFISAIDRSIDCGNGGPNLTSALEMSLSVDEMGLLRTYGSCRPVRSFCGYGGQYCLGIELKAASKVWSPGLQRHEAFARAAA